ncbi:MAG TPA: hypothetical protein VHB18_15745 [Mycobacteriales bacterium]|jgi:hypothetical protein|nr:hypothetical protein [Mycobacteriales bacterium]
MASMLVTYWQARLRPVPDRDRGDVPGWVLITMMTAGIVVALWVVAEPTLRNLLTGALNIAGDPNN